MYRIVVNDIKIINDINICPGMVSILFNLSMISMRMIDIPSPKNTDRVALILCFTTSVSLEAFNLGYFRFIISPSTDWNAIVTSDVRIIRIVSCMVGVNFMKKIISLSIMNGSSIMNGNIIFDFIIVDVFIGRLFVILIVFPSSDIDDDVIDVIDIIISTIQKYMNVIDMFVVSPYWDSIKLFIILSLKHNAIERTRIMMYPKAVFII